MVHIETKIIWKNNSAFVKIVQIFNLTHIYWNLPEHDNLTTWWGINLERCALKDKQEHELWNRPHHNNHFTSINMI